MVLFELLYFINSSSLYISC